MELGMIGLGRMGANMVRRLLKHEHQCIVYDRSVEAVQALVKEGAVGSTSLKEFVSQLKTPRAIWLMIPAALVDATLTELSAIIEAGDIIIDGGTSGGVWGFERGYCQMIGCETEVVTHLNPIFKALAPGQESVPATPGRNNTSTAQDGYLH